MTGRTVSKSWRAGGLRATAGGPHSSKRRARPRQWAIQPAGLVGARNSCRARAVTAVRRSSGGGWWRPEGGAPRAALTAERAVV